MTNTTDRYQADLAYLQQTMTPTNAKHFLGIYTVLRKYMDLNAHRELLEEVYDSKGYPFYAPDDEDLIDAVEKSTLRTVFKKDLIELIHPDFQYEDNFYELCYEFEELNQLLDDFNALNLENEPTEERINKAKEIMTQMIPLLDGFLPCWVNLRLKMIDAFGYDI